MLDKLNQDLKDAMRAKDEVKVRTLRFLLADIKKVTIDQVKRESGLSPEEVMEVIKRNIKMRREAIEEYKKANRLDKSKDEEDELKVLESYLPKQLDAAMMEKVVADIITKVGATSKKDFGKVMKALQLEYPGQIDGSLAKEIITKKLS